MNNTSVVLAALLGLGIYASNHDITLSGNTTMIAVFGGLLLGYNRMVTLESALFGAPIITAQTTPIVSRSACTNVATTASSCF